jgi:methyltransferase (TIGR00027 family)
MEVGRPSRTAMAVAQARAHHQVADEPRIFSDRFAQAIVGEPDGDTGEFDRGLDPGFVRKRRLFIAARSRFADDTVAAAIAAGSRQVVVLGAGLDTSAYRNTHAGVRFFEVDHPGTQEWKRHRLADAGIEIPPTLAFVPLDFETSTLGDGLADAGFDRDRGAVFVMLGIVAYLTKPSITGTWQYIAGQGGGATLVLDYMYPPTESDERLRERAGRVAARGEPWLSWFTPDQIRGELGAVGLTVVEDYPGSALLNRYLEEKFSVPSDSVGILMARTSGL